MTPDEQRDEQRDDQPGSANAAWSIVSYLLSGMAVWGGAGWLLDRWAGLDAVFFPIGLIAGIGAALYIVYVRYGRS